jgi:hypothetical protein
MKTYIIAASILVLAITAALAFDHGAGVVFIADGSNVILTNDSGSNNLLAQ